MIRLLAVAVLVLVSTACVRTVSPDVGEEAVLIYKPWFFGHGGVDPTPVKTGRSIEWMSTSFVYVNMQPQQFEGNFADLMSSDGVPLDFHTSIRLQVTDSVRLISQFGPNWYAANVEQAFFNRVRTAVKKHGMNETAINTDAVEAIDAEVSSELEAYITSLDLPVKLLSVTVGKANPPDAVKNQRVETAQQEQRVLSEAKRDLAEQARKAAETSRAQADNAYRNALGLNPEQFVELERIRMQKEVCGTQGTGCTFIVGNAPIVVGR